MIRHWMIRLTAFALLAAGTAVVISRMAYYNSAFTGIVCGLIDLMLAEITGLIIERWLDRRKADRGLRELRQALPYRDPVPDPPPAPTPQRTSIALGPDGFRMPVGD